MSSITTHVLDTSLGKPAAGVSVTLTHVGKLAGTPTLLAESHTDDDGRITGALSVPMERGTYRLTFDTGEYFRTRGVEAFYPEVTITFEVRDAAQHHHVPLLLSPFGYSTYRGS